MNALVSHRIRAADVLAAANTAAAEVATRIIQTWKKLYLIQSCGASSIIFVTNYMHI